MDKDWNKGDRLLQQFLMQNGEPEAEVCGWALCSHPGREISWGLDCSERVYPASKPPDPAGTPCGLLSCGGSAEIHTHPPCVHSTFTLQSPRAPHLGSSLTLQPWTLPGLGFCCPSPQSSHCELSTGMSGLERKCSLLLSPEKDQGAGQGSESMHRHPPKQGFSPQKAKGLLSSP